MARQFSKTPTPDDAVNCGDFASVDGLTTFTMGAWVKRDSSNALVNISKFSSVNSDISIQVFSDGNIYFAMRNGANTSANFARNVTTWDRLLMVFDGALVGDARLTCFLNGASQALSYTGAMPATTPTNAGDFIIGSINSGGSDGSIAEVKLWSTALNAGQAKDDYYGRGPHADLGYWPLGYGSPEPDYSGAGNNGTLVSSPSIVDHPPIGTQFGYDESISPYEVAAAGGHGGLLSSQRNRLVGV